VVLARANRRRVLVAVARNRCVRVGLGR